MPSRGSSRRSNISIVPPREKGFMSSDSNNVKALRETPAPPPEALPRRDAKELADALRIRADLLSGQHWEVPATQAMMREAESLLISQQAALEHLRQERDELG